MYRGTPEKHSYGSQVVLSGNLVLDKWRNTPLGVRGAMPHSELGKPIGLAFSTGRGRMSH